MTTKATYKRPLTIEELKAMPDEGIDFSDIPELDGNFWRSAVLVRPDKEMVSIRLDKDVLDFFRKFGPGYQTRINNLLRMYVVRARVDERKGKSSKAHGVAESREAFRPRRSRARKTSSKRKG